jgi:hypothetical protein
VTTRPNSDTTPRSNFSSTSLARQSSRRVGDVELAPARSGLEVIDSHPAERGLPGVLSRTSYEPPGHLRFETGAGIGQALFAMTDGTMWWLHGEHRYGCAAFQAAPTGYSSETLRKATWVCKRIDPILRRTDLPWSYHQAVAALKPRDQKELLAAASPDPDDEHGRPRLNVRELRTEVTRIRRRLDSDVEVMHEPQCRCSGCRDSWPCSAERAGA